MAAFESESAAASPADKPSSDQPAGVGGRIVQMTPIILTVLATALAGMSSSEMTQSMYYRSLAGQHQSKAGDQWAFFQAKRIRGTSLEGTVTLLHSLGNVDPLDADRLKSLVAGVTGSLEALSPDAKLAAKSTQGKFDQWLATADKNQSLKYLIGPDLPRITDQQLPETEAYTNLRAAVKEMAHRHSDSELANIVKNVAPAQIEDATLLAEQNADAFDRACEPTTAAMTQLRAIVAELNADAKSSKPAPPKESGDNKDATNPNVTDPNAVDPIVADSNAAADRLPTQLHQLATTVEAAAADYDARRYRRESSYNRKAAELYELRVARSGVSSDEHRERSRKFFFSMLLAQAGVTISSLALARSNRSLFWTFAALAGLGSLVFTGMTYFSAG